MATQEQKALLVDLTGKLGIMVMQSMKTPYATNEDFDFLLNARNTLLKAASNTIDYNAWIHCFQLLEKKYKKLLKA